MVDSCILFFTTSRSTEDPKHDVQIAKSRQIVDSCIFFSRRLGRQRFPDLMSITYKHEGCHSYYRLGARFLIKYLFTLQQVSRSHAWRLFFFFKNDGRVSNLCQPSDPFSDLYLYYFSRGSKSWSTLRPLFRSIFLLFWGFEIVITFDGGGPRTFLPEV